MFAIRSPGQGCLTVFTYHAYSSPVTIELPEIAAMEKLSPEELRLELACALYGRGKIGKIAAADLAGVTFFEFQRALGERRIPSTTDEMLDEDLATLKALFPR